MICTKQYFNKITFTILVSILSFSAYSNIFIVTNTTDCFKCNLKFDNSTSTRESLSSLKKCNASVRMYKNFAQTGLGINNISPVKKDYVIILSPLNLNSFYLNKDIVFINMGGQSTPSSINFKCKINGMNLVSGFNKITGRIISTTSLTNLKKILEEEINSKNSKSKTKKHKSKHKEKRKNKSYNKSTNTSDIHCIDWELIDSLETIMIDSTRINKVIYTTMFGIVKGNYIQLAIAKGKQDDVKQQLLNTIPARLKKTIKNVLQDK